MATLSLEDLFSIYSLGRVYFELGKLSEAETIFLGLSHLDSGQTPASLSLGVVKLEKGEYKESIPYFQVALQNSEYAFNAKIGICAALVAQKEFEKAKKLLPPISDSTRDSVSSELRALRVAFLMRCDYAIEHVQSEE